MGKINTELAALIVLYHAVDLITDLCVIHQNI